MPLVYTEEIRQAYWIIVSVEKMEIFPKYVVAFVVVVCVDLRWFVAYCEHWGNKTNILDHR